MASPFPYYFFNGNLVSFATPDKFFDYYHVCKCCLVRPMCLQFDRTDDARHSGNVRAQKPCKEFLRLVKIGELEIEKGN